MSAPDRSWWTEEMHALATEWAEQYLDQHYQNEGIPAHPLDRSQAEDIRILELQPGQGDDTIVCRLKPQPLVSPARFRSTEPYEAVSYVWGDPSLIHRIEIQAYSSSGLSGDDTTEASRPFSVTGSVYKLLRHLRNPEKPRRLWIDQICIRQEDREEKMRQIRRMAEIYSGAFSVIIWLGDGKDRSPDEIKFVHTSIDLYSHLQKTTPESAGVQSDQPNTVTRNIDDSFLPMELESIGNSAVSEWEDYVRSHARGSPTSLDELLAAGMALFEQFLQGQRWFSRAWTFQECVMSRDAQVVYGSDSRNWKLLVQACQYIAAHATSDRRFAISRSLQVGRLVDDIVLRGAYHQDASDLLIQLQGPSHPLWEEQQKRSERNGFERLMGKTRLKALLPLLRPTEATEPVDKVFALTGFAHDDGSNIIFPNHPQEVGLLYLSVVKYWINSPRTSTAVRTTGRADKYTYWDEIPSPLYVQEPDMSFLSHIRYDHDNRHFMPTWVPDWSLPLEVVPLSECHNFRASGDWVEPAIINDAGFIPDLRIPGIHVMTIAKISASPQAYEEHTEILGAPGTHYPLTSMTYLDAYLQLMRPVDISNVSAPPSSQDANGGFWRHRRGGTEVTKLHNNHSPNKAHYTHEDIKNALNKEPSQQEDHAAQIRCLAEGRSLVTTDAGFIGLAPRLTAPGDQVHVLPGAATPIILRETGMGSFILIGECYIFGIMHGEAMEQLPPEEVKGLVLL
ncbi:heterokaryon incompatibility protein-domain-containing protein [Stachybotrys elegans]|uniref:Heterokaryon incompatibility protein-domain-containing protein n=1 Tax=Stachybotrys elegans TaxID=80388 RepID=A0A8K0WU36_9HYPO|nr:heterokaryon incompatibility protein-domain-containing protein [Stachybotrys elegans]